MAQITRRKLIAASLGSIGALTAAYCGVRWSGAPPRESSESSESADTVMRRSGHALGTHVSITIALADASKAGETKAAASLDAAFAELERVEDVLSIYRANSDLSRLNRDGALDEPHPYFTQVLRESLEMSHRTSGAFDVTVQPLWRVYAEASRQGRMPDAATLRAARQLVDYRRIEADEAHVRFNHAPTDDASGMAITFNGIAQGFAVDRVKSVLQSHGTHHALFDMGELGALGDKSVGAPWKVGIQHPRDPEAFVAVARMDGRSLATSGDYATAFTADRTANHVFDPRTGRSPTQFSSVSIMAPTAMQADAMSTAVFVLGFDDGMELVRQTPGADALFVFKDGREFVTPGFPQIRS